MLAFFYDKFAEWTHSGRDPEKVLTRDEILDDVTLYWLTNTGTSSSRSYWDAAQGGGGPFNAFKITKVPVAVTIFPGEIYRAPRNWAEQGFSEAHLLERGQQGRSLRGLGTAGAFQRGGPSRVQTTPQIDLKSKAVRTPCARSPSQTFKERTMTQLAQQRTTEARGKVIYTAKTHTTGGRENGVSRSSDGRLDVKLSVPGSPRVGTNPEQLFAAGWSACFEGALGVAAHKKKIKLPADVAIDAEVDLHLDSGEYLPQCRPQRLHSRHRTEHRAGLVEDAERLSYSKIKGNIAVTYKVV